MPLILMCGLPSSGKSTRVAEIVELLSSTGKDVHIITENFITSEAKNGCFVSSLSEKELRSTLKSEVERYLTPDRIVILDALNYIKGYRYELYCISKHIKTTHCVVLCEIGADVAKKWNSGRAADQKYNEEVFDALVMRFEAPDSRNRWDYPLFTAHPGDELPVADLLEALLNRKPPPPNQSTQTKPLTSANFLHELDRRTQEIVTSILRGQEQGMVTSVPITGTSESVHLTRSVTMAELRRARRQFISYTTLHPVESHMISSLFVQYLNTVM